MERRLSFRSPSDDDRREHRRPKRRNPGEPAEAVDFWDGPFDLPDEEVPASDARRRRGGKHGSDRARRHGTRRSLE